MVPVQRITVPEVVSSVTLLWVQENLIVSITSYEQEKEENAALIQSSLHIALSASLDLYLKEKKNNMLLKKKKASVLQTESGGAGG